MQKRGNFDISFSMIFSIIIIIAIIGVAFYVISSFVSVSNCAEIGLFYDGLQEHIDKAWKSTIHKDTFTGKLPLGIELVCFGSLTQTPPRDYISQYNSILRSNINSKNRNVFLYPIHKSCDATLFAAELENIKTDEFFCIPVKDSKIELKTEKDQFDAQVTLTS